MCVVLAAYMPALSLLSVNTIITFILHSMQRKQYGRSSTHNERYLISGAETGLAHGPASEPSHLLLNELYKDIAFRIITGDQTQLYPLCMC